MNIIFPNQENLKIYTQIESLGTDFYLSELQFSWFGNIWIANKARENELKKVRN